MTKLIIVSIVFLVSLILITFGFVAQVEQGPNGEFRDKDVKTFVKMIVGNACLFGFVTGLIISNVIIG